MEKIIKARVQHKHDVEANWLKATNFTPLASEIIVYDPDESYDYPRIKIGDGKTNINSLPFITEDYAKIADIPTKPADIGAQPAGNYLTSIPSEYVTDSELNAKGYLTDYTESDPTVPAWAKAATKPSYTKADVGLGNVDNTSDANKPVSTKQATAIADAKKAGTDAQANLDTHTNNFSNPHFITKSQIGLDYVENVRQYSVNNPPILAQPTPPDDPNALWVDTSDDGDDGFQEAVKTAVAQAKGEIAAEVKASLNKEQWVFTLEDGSTVTKVVYVG